MSSPQRTPYLSARGEAVLDASAEKNRAYGDAVAWSLGLTQTPALHTQSLTGAQIGMTRVSCGAARLGMTKAIPAEDTFIAALYLTELPHHELWSGGCKVISQGYRQNAMRIVNLEAQYSALISAAHESVYLYMPRASLDAFTDEADRPRVSHFSCEPGSIDPVFASLGQALLPAFESPQETSSLFLDQLALALSAHLISRYGVSAASPAPLRGGLSPQIERRAKEFLATSVADDVSIAELAAACGLSRGHFLRAFKASTGTTPYRWLQNYRIERAKTLLLSPDVTIADIALQCGFADQSHLTRVFGLLVGVPPGTWRKTRAGKPVA